MKTRITLLSGWLMLLMSHMTPAATATPDTCPTAEQISQLNYAISFPYAFDNRALRAKFIVGAGLDEETTSNAGNWLLVMYPIAIRQSDDIVSVSESVIHRLVPSTTTPFQSDIDGSPILFCAYALPGHEGINALAYFMGDDADEENDSDDGYDDPIEDDHASVKAPAKMTHRHMKLLKLMKRTKHFIM